ncbi:neuronal acetylcholine receptor subunit alpha-6-like [Ruditapes philippinarum]|uniref:neuronal acetylcholine receptor subunit alpha-6-like n=1 Tax=Ruditapes philippinarum TaxID=129788 RepID=UPI00295B1F49|nr:neuronal acetylcholine receptor subunit alpha-6-like [Ruditapes philippinarum]
MLTWDPALFGGREKIQLPKDKYWKPEISLTDGPANEDTSIYGSGFYPAWATYQGIVMIIAAGSYKTKCIVDTTFYPYDMHSCYFQFIVSNYDSTELMISSPSPDIHFSDFKENGEWEVKSTDTNVMLVKEKNIDSVGIPMYQSSFLLKRRSKFEMINSLTPIMFMLFLNIATCFVRPESGERTTFAITLYLALVFAATSLTETIPRNSLKMPMISYQLLSVNIINTVGVLWSIFIVNCASKSVAHRYLPNFLLRMITKRRHKSKNNIKMVPVENSVVSILPVEGTDISDGQKEEVCNEPQSANITGQEVAEVLDTIYFWMIIICIILTNAIYSAFVYKSWFQLDASGSCVFYVINTLSKPSESTSRLSLLFNSLEVGNLWKIGH